MELFDGIGTDTVTFGIQRHILTGQQHLAEQFFDLIRLFDGKEFIHFLIIVIPDVHHNTAFLKKIYDDYIIVTNFKIIDRQFKRLLVPV